MLKFVIRRNCLHPATGDIETTFETFKVSVPVIESALDRKWGGIKDASVVECRILKEDAEASTQPITSDKSEPSDIVPHCQTCSRLPIGFFCLTCKDLSNYTPKQRLLSH
jgi:hypothetical protein